MPVTFWIASLGEAAGGFMLRSPMLQFVLAAFVALLSHTAPAEAQSGTFGIVWVASNGSSNASCQRNNPCATIDQALAAVTAGGVIMCADNGTFSGTTITHSVTIDCTGTDAFVGQIIIQLGFASDVVILRVFLMDGFNACSGPPASGLINFIAAGTLRLEDIRISKLLGSAWSGVQFQPAGTAKLTMTNCDITGIGNGGTTAGINIKPTSGVTADIVIERSRIAGNHFGIIADGTGGGIIRGIVSDSFVTNNRNNGITVSSSGSTTVLTIDNTKVSGNTFGLVAGGANAGLLVTRSVINANATGLLSTSGAALLSYRDNRLNANFTTDGAFTGVVNTQ
jgi:hypothetical protein